MIVHDLCGQIRNSGCTHGVLGDINFWPRCQSPATATHQIRSQPASSRDDIDGHQPSITATPVQADGDSTMRTEKSDVPLKKFTRVVFGSFLAGPERKKDE
jgi:hypothetical protein